MFKFWFLLIFLFFLVLVFSLKVGYTDIGFLELFNTLSKPNVESNFSHIIYELRLPRMIAAFVVGISLSLSGVILQSILKNPLASPFTLGLSQGAAFGASFSIIILSSTTITITYLGELNLIVIGAFFGSILAASIIIGLSFIKEITPESLILSGVALASLFGALTMLLQYFANDNELASAVFWTFGDLSKGTYTEIIILAIVILISLIFVMYKAWDFNAIIWDENYSKSLGIKTWTLRVYAIFIASLLTSVATAFYGVIGFVGLVAPHVIKIIYPHAKHHFLFLSSSFLGGVFLMCSDLLARQILSPINLPVGILTAFVGVPLFLYIIIRKSLNDRTR
ncbi:ABC transporter permease [Arcobacter sp. F155]|uniref:FecCD family ABC transporter permease n=1 Tax=Arcobacter sp. F155 TaxID=2044512 RepID=UPI00100BB8B0|nr:iron ABC transporter permease [Arcobacter sp. F155]RXJ77090.1 ABC transporter permease [Arcobacter sp. F155]